MQFISLWWWCDGVCVAVELPSVVVVVVVLIVVTIIPVYIYILGRAIRLAS